MFLNHYQNNNVDAVVRYIFLFLKILLRTLKIRLLHSLRYHNIMN